MNVELDWQAANDDGVWEPVATMERRYAWPHWGWACSAWIGALLLLAVTSALVVARRYDRARDRIAFQIQSVIDLETRALAQGDTARFLAQQDPTPYAWYERRATCVSMGLLPVRRQTSSSCAHVLADVAPHGIPLTSSPQVRAAGLRGEVAWAEVIVGRGRTRQVRFYRQTAQGWLHTAPDASYWWDPVEQTYDGLTIYCRERDLPHLEPLIEHIRAIDGTQCAILGCPAADRLAVEFIPHSMRPALLGDRLVLPSPWLSGIPSQGQWDGAYLDELAYWVVYARAAQLIRSDKAAPPGETAPLNEVQQAILHEYAAWGSGAGRGDAPLLGRIVRAYGAGAAVEALRSLQGAPSASQFAARWSLAFPDRHERAGFEALLAVAQDALRSGCPDTFRVAAGLLAEEGSWQAGTVEYLHELD